MSELKIAATSHWPFRQLRVVPSKNLTCPNFAQSQMFLFSISP